MNAISLFSGAGGFDVGFKKAGFDILWANDLNGDACETYRNNIGNHIHQGDVNSLKQAPIMDLSGIDVVFGGPPCQGFSVAGKMDPHDPRSQLVWIFADMVKRIQPRAFAMENVKALGQLAKWRPLRDELLNHFRTSGYMASHVVLNASDYNVPQSRERVFFVGFKGNPSETPDLQKMIGEFSRKSPTVRETLGILDKAGTGNNMNLAKARITMTTKPVIRKSPYAGMLFNGAGRPVRLDGYCHTLPATMGGNRTPIVDEEALHNGDTNWIEQYHERLRSGQPPMTQKEAPKRLRRLTTQEAALLQTFPPGYSFAGSQSSIFRQIENAVPCNLGHAVASMVSRSLNNGKVETIG